MAKRLKLDKITDNTPDFGALILNERNLWARALRLTMKNQG